MKPDDLIEFSELLEAAIADADAYDLAEVADSVINFDVDDDEVQGIFDSGFEIAVKLGAARADGTDARVYFGDDEDDKVRYFFIAKSEDEAVARVVTLSSAEQDQEEHE